MSKVYALVAAIFVSATPTIGVAQGTHMPCANFHEIPWRITEEAERQIFRSSTPTFVQICNDASNNIPARFTRYYSHSPQDLVSEDINPGGCVLEEVVRVLISTKLAPRIEPIHGFVRSCAPQ